MDPIELFDGQRCRAGGQQPQMAEVRFGIPDDIHHFAVHCRNAHENRTPGGRVFAGEKVQHRLRVESIQHQGMRSGHQGGVECKAQPVDMK